MKITKKLAAITAAIVMSVSTMAVSASAADVTTGNSSHGHLKVSLTTNAASLNDNASTIASNTNGYSQKMYCRSNIYKRVGTSIDVNKDTSLGQKSNSGTTASVSSGQVSVASNSSQKRYGRGYAIMYNSGVETSGECCSVSVTCYYV